MLLLELLGLITLMSAETANAASPAANFDEWKEMWGKVYDSAEEEAFRRVVFTKNQYHVEFRNAEQSSVVLKLNQFADLLQDEFSARYLGGYRMGSAKTKIQSEPVVTVPYTDLPASVDWSQKGAVTPIKNQGQCGSCWSFSTTGSVEGAWFIKTGELVSLSEQQLVDCSGPEGNMGCNGGLMDDAFQYIIKNGGICSEAAYPYTSGGGSNGTCHSCTAVANITSYVDVQPKNETALLLAVAQQPVSVAVEADGLDWQFYFGGVVTDACGTNLDHGVLVVGYGNDTTAGPFWKVKNSWGSSWGEQGFIRLGRGSKFTPNGECGILMDPSYPVV